MKSSLLTDQCLRHPVSTSMVFTALVVLGVASLLRIPLETYPELEIPRMTITGSWSEASPEAVEAFVTSPLEAEASTLKGIEEVSSRSQRGSARIDLEFSPGTDMDFARLELNEKITRLREFLPPHISINVKPYVPLDMREENLLQYTFTGLQSVNELQRYAVDLIQRPLSVVSGIAGIDVYGGEQRQIRAVLDQNKAEALGIDHMEVAYNLQQIASMVETVGMVKQGTFQYNLVVREDFDDLSTLRDAIVARRGNRYIRLGEIARVVDGYAEPQGYQRLNGRARVAIFISAVAGSNIIDVAERVKARIEEIRPTLPAGTQLIEENDNSETIRNELEGLEFRSVLIIFLIFSVLLVFLRGIANPLIILSSIATSVLLTISLFYFLGASLNMMTLAGLALGFGMMVDNSIVVLDNIHRHRERGSGRLAAASIGTAQVLLPILTGTATTIIVFLPFLYLQGELRVMYVPFALAVVVSLACSLLVSFTLIPSLAARVLGPTAAVARAGEGSGAAGGVGQGITAEDPWALGELEKEEEAGLTAGGAEAAEHTLAIGDNLYQKILRWMLTHKFLVVFIVLVSFGVSYHLFDKYVTKGRIWRSYGPSGEYLSVSISAPTGSDLDVMEGLIDGFEAKLLPLYQSGQVENFETSISAQYASIRISFPDEIVRQGIPYLVKDQLSVFAGLLAGGMRISVTGFGDYFSAGSIGSFSYSSRITFLGYNYLRVKELAEELAQRLKRNPRIRDVNTNYGFLSRGGEKQIVLRFNRQALAAHGLTASDMVYFVRRYVRTTAGGRVTYGGEEVDFQVKVEGYDDRDVIELMNAMVMTSSGGRVRMRDLGELTIEPVMGVIQRQDQQYTRTVGYEFRGPYKMGERVREQIMDETILPNGYEFDESERIWQTEEEKQQLMLVLGFAILLVYMLTAALFESFFHPFTIILTVPMALVGIFLGYFFFDKGFDRSAYVGVILMGGIVVNNSIILVDHINSLRRFLPRRDAVVRAARERARPILMTTFTTVIGLLPLIIGAREGQDQWYTLAFTICVALPVAAFFTLTIIPLVYELMDTLQTRFRRGVGTIALAMQGEEVYTRSKDIHSG